ncbi:hypothetical protein GF385_03970 [Candidatus Dependentiae bacterium]|nr:hypothetical protein [Candidatus Dependentiae bacterium]
MKIFKNIFLKFISIIFIVIFVGCGKQSQKLTYEEKLKKDIDSTLLEYNRLYKKELEIITSNLDEDEKIEKISEAALSTYRNNKFIHNSGYNNIIRYHSYNDYVIKSIKKLKFFFIKMKRSKKIRSKEIEYFNNIRTDLNNLLDKLKTLFFLICESSKYIEEERFLVSEYGDSYIPQRYSIK